jgi:hypothetical protein
MLFPFLDGGDTRISALRQHPYCHQLCKEERKRLNVKHLLSLINVFSSIRSLKRKHSLLILENSFFNYRHSGRNCRNFDT